MEEFIQSYRIKPLIIKDKRVLRDSYIPSSLPGREEQISTFHNILSDLIIDSPPDHTSFTGKPGTGKTAVAKHVIEKYKKEYPGLRAKFVYINCSQANTAYRVMYQLNRALQVLVPPSGYPYDVLYDKFMDAFTQLGKRLVVVLDEVDLLVRRDGGRLLYSLSRLNYELPEQLSLSLVVISNTADFLERLDPRTRSSFEPTKIIFPPYKQPQLYQILHQRAELGLKPGTWENEALHIIAAKVAQESGDARRAIDVLRMAAELAEREGAKKLTVDHARKALETVNEEEVAIIVRTLPLHHRLILAAIANLMELKERGRVDRISTGRIYREYKERATKIMVMPLTMRRVSGILRELEAQGLIEIVMDYGGARGNTKVVKAMALPPEEMKRLLMSMGLLL